MLEKLCNLDNKTAIITGASSGLGVQFAKALTKAGARVALVARREEKLKKVKEMLTQMGGKIEYYTADVTISDQVEKCIHSIQKDFGQIDILVNNAGFATLEPTEEHNLDSWHSPTTKVVCFPFSSSDAFCVRCTLGNSWSGPTGRD
ncbi:MAG TPA: SDR family NAD(P)-dependent oxidoreductase [Desulfonatronum sp.]|nr:SDR family NAD(P)-dependent oxidoreductase [Desulfonatronum sp.]